MVLQQRDSIPVRFARFMRVVRTTRQHLAGNRQLSSKVSTKYWQNEVGCKGGYAGQSCN
jgi:hypothetical protein